MTVEDNVAYTSGGGLVMVGSSSGGDIQIINSSFINNRAFQNGGGASIESHFWFPFFDVIFRNNIANSLGGGLYIGSACKGIASHCLFEINIAKSGGAIASIGDTMSEYDVSSSHILHNIASAEGGGLYSGGRSQLSLLNCTVRECSAGSHGGGISMRNDSTVWIKAPVVVRGCNAGAQREGFGGGVLAAGRLLAIAGPLTVRDNKAAKGGGMYYMSQVFLEGNFVSTIFGNSATREGGGLYGSR